MESSKYYIIKINNLKYKMDELENMTMINSGIYIQIGPNIGFSNYNVDTIDDYMNQRYHSNYLTSFI